MGTEVLRPQDCLVDRFRVSPAAFHRRKSNGNGIWNGNGNGYSNTKPVSNHISSGYRKPPVVRPDKEKSSGSDQKKRFNNNNHQVPATISRKTNGDSSTNGPVMGQVTILRRGQSLDSLESKAKKEKKASTAALVVKKSCGDEDLVVCGTGRLGPEQPEMVPKQILVGKSSSSSLKADVYAGSAFSMSPSPSSLPLPSFFNKKEEAKKPFDDSASRDLRRLLRLE